MDYRVNQDIESIIEILGITRDHFAAEIGVSRVAVSNWCSGKTKISNSNIKQIYEYAFQKGVRLNRIKEQLYIEDRSSKSDILLFHGAKMSIEGKVDLVHSKQVNDFGKGFYCGESLEQSAMFVANQPGSCLDMLSFNNKGLKKRVFHVDRDWMLTVAYYRGTLKEYEDSETIKKLVSADQGADYIIAPIADNRMFEIIDSFIAGEITDEQCRHCLSATDLGNQYVFRTQKAVDRVTILERCYLADAEKEYYLESRQASYMISQDKVKLARRQYRNQGEYIEEILK